MCNRVPCLNCFTDSLPNPSGLETIDFLNRLIRAKLHQMSGIDLQMRESEMLAARFESEGKHEAALSETRIFLDFKAEHAKEQLKREQLIKLVRRIEAAQRDASMLQGMFQSSKTLAEILATMPDASQVVDQLKEQGFLLGQVERELLPPPRRGGEEEDELNLPNAPTRELTMTIAKGKDELQPLLN